MYPKNPRLGLFSPFFGQKIIFKKFGPVMCNTAWALSTMLSSRKKLKSQFHENFRTEGRTDLINIYDLINI